MEMTGCQGDSGKRGERGVRLALLILGLAIVGLCYGYNLGSPVLWGDEADTGVFADNILLHGYPYCFDGRNLTFYEGGIVHSKALVNVRVSWLPFYVGALSLKFFGRGEAGLRCLFALIGSLSFLPLYAMARKRLQAPWVVSVLLLITPQIVLFQRNARYYPLLIFSYLLLLLYLTTAFRSKGKEFIVGSLCSVFICHTHQFSALTAAMAFVAYVLVRRSFRANIAKLAALMTGVISLLIWSFSHGDTFGRQPMLIDLAREDAWGWCLVSLRNIMISLVDLDFVNALPLLALALLCGYGLVNRRSEFISRLWADDLFVFLLLTLGIHVVATASTFGLETEQNYSILRYMPHLVLGCTLIAAVLVNAVIRSKAAILVAMAGLTMTNLVTVSYWTHPRDVAPPVSWWGPVYGEILNPPHDPWRQIFARLRDGQKDTAGREVIAVFPKYLNELLIYYLGREYLIQPPVEPGSDKERDIIAVIGEEAMQAFWQRPSWAISFFPFEEYPPGYNMEAIPFSRPTPDSTRPELTRHFFADEDNPNFVYLYH